MKFIFFLVLTTLAIFACSQPDTPKKRTLDCYIRFDEAQGTVMADASFQETTPEANKPVEMPGGVFYQNVAMELLPIQGMTYRKEYPAGFMREHTFRWEEAAGKSASFTMRMNPLKEFGFGGDTVWHDRPATLKWKGPGLEKGEALVLIWEQKNAGKTVSMELITIGNDAAIYFPAAKMAQLSPGNWTVYLVRKKLSKSLVNNTGVTCTAELYSRIKAIRVL